MIDLAGGKESEEFLYATYNLADSFLLASGVSTRWSWRNYGLATSIHTSLLRWWTLRSIPSNLLIFFFGAISRVLITFFTI